jgi:cytochrome c oxidase subunit II
MRGRRRWLLLGSGVLLAACDGPQSALDPGGPIADSLNRLGIVMYVGAAVVTLLVTVLMLIPFLRRRAGGVNERLFLRGGGVALRA